MSNKHTRICPAGHKYVKSSDCPVCPTCEENRKPDGGFLSLLVAPARRALENNGITTLEKLSTYRKEEILQFHGIGPTSIPKLQTALEEVGLKLKK